MGRCRVCDRELPEEARFCPTCGTPVDVSSGEERRLVTVLFADAVGSTGIGERLDPEHLRALQRELFATMRDVITGEGGTVEKYAGDSVMAVFGAPVAHEDDAARAIRAAERLHERVAQLGLQLRIGVNTGEAVASSATANSDTALVTGDVVNVAARLEQLAEPGQTVVAARTARACPSIRTRPLGDVELRGREAPVDAVIVLGTGTGPGTTSAPGLRAPMVGRERELQLLTTLFDRTVASGRPELVTIYGEPGVGKSRLARELGAWLEVNRPGTRILRGRCLPYGDGITFWPLAEILKSVAGILDSDTGAEAAEKLTAIGNRLLTPERVPDAQTAIAALAYTIGIDGAAAIATPLTDTDPRRVRSEMHSAWRALFCTLAAEQPLCVVIEDVQWADPVLLDLVEDVAERATGPILLVCPSRPELSVARPTWGAGRRSTSLTLDPLPDDDAGALVDVLLDLAELPADDAPRIRDRAEGNPFFLEEIVRQLVDTQRAGARAMHIPDTVQGVLAARLDLLEPAVKRVAQQAAVVGREFWTGAVAALTGMDEADVADALDALEEREVIVSRPSSSLAGQREYAFKHILTRDVAYDGLVRRERADAHIRMSAWIEATYGARCCELAELLAHHRLAAYRAAADAGATGVELDELRAPARVALLDAADDAADRYALAKARRLGEEALALAADDVERAEAHEAIGKALWLGHGTGTEAWTQFVHAADIHLSRPDPDPFAIARTCARAVEIPSRWPATMRTLPDPADVRRYLDAGLAHLPDGDSPERVALLVAVAMWPTSFEKGLSSEIELEQAREAGEDAAAMAMRLGRPDLASAALDGAFGYFQYLGRLGDPGAMAIIDRRLALVPELRTAPEIGDTFAMAAWQRYTAGRYADAAAFATEGFERVREDAPPMAMHNLVWLAKAQFRLGQLDGVLATVALGDELLGPAWTPAPFCAPLYGVAAAVHALRGDDAERRDVILRTGVTDALGAPRSLLTPWLARAELFAGAYGAADAHLDAGRDLLGGEGRADVLEARCEIALAGRRWTTAPILVSEARSHGAYSGHLALPFVADRLEGATLVAAGDAARGRELLGRALDGFTSIGGGWDAAWTRLLLDGDDRPLAEMGVAAPVLARLRAV
jgi:class 3 adenylate cyclase